MSETLPLISQRQGLSTHASIFFLLNNCFFSSSESNSDSIIDRKLNLPGVDLFILCIVFSCLFCNSGIRGCLLSVLFVVLGSARGGKCAKPRCTPHCLDTEFEFDGGKLYDLTIIISKCSASPRKSFMTALQQRVMEYLRKKSGFTWKRMHPALPS